MLIRRTLLFTALLATVSIPNTARSAPRPVAPARLTEETLVPTEVFLPDDGKKFGYPNGVEVVYSRTDKGHVWKLTEKSLLMASPTPAPEAGASPAAAATPTPDAGKPLAPTAGENDFLATVGFVRPTFVTIAFLDSAQTANARVEDFFKAKSDEAGRPQNLAVMQLERDAKLSPGAVVYGREFNLGPKSGGMRRGYTILLAKGSTIVQVDAFWGLKDGAYEAELDTLERRARAVAAQVMKRL